MFLSRVFYHVMWYVSLSVVNKYNRMQELVARLSLMTPGELGVSKSIECDIFPSVLRHCWLGDRKGIRPVKKTGCWFVGGDDLTGALHDL